MNKPAQYFQIGEVAIVVSALNFKEMIGEEVIISSSLVFSKRNSWWYYEIENPPVKDLEGTRTRFAPRPDRLKKKYLPGDSFESIMSELTKVEV